MSRTLRRFVLADELVPITIRFLAHADEEELEFCRWSIQGSIQRRNGIRAAKGFTLDFAESRRTFRLHMEPPEARIFARQVIAFVEEGSVVVTLGGLPVSSAILVRKRA